MRLLVVGGGITGLAAAWEACAQGIQATVCEATSEWGGKVRTAQIDGCYVDLGPDSVVAYRPAALKLAAELGLQDQIIQPGANRRVSLHARGAMRPMPEGMGMVLPTKLWPFVTTKILTWSDKIHAVKDLVLPRQLQTNQDVAIGALLRKRLGAGIVTRFANPMVGGIYGASVDELSLDAVLPILREQEHKYRSLMLASLAAGRNARKNMGNTRGPNSVFRTPKTGMGAFTQALVEQLKAKNVTLLPDTEVTKLTWDGQYTTAVLNQGGNVQEQQFDAVILAGGVNCSAALLRDTVPQAARVLDQIPLASSTAVTFCFAAEAFEPRLDSQGWLEAQQAPISGVTVSSVKYAGRAPEGKVLARAFVPERLGDLCHADEDTLLAKVKPWVVEHLGALQDPQWHHVQRWTHVMPKYTVGHLERVAQVDNALAEAVPVWKVAGSALHGVGVPDCIADARRQVQQLQDQLVSK